MKMPERAVPALPATDRRRWFSLVVLAMGLSMIVVDGTIVSVALPAIIRALQLDLSDALWINGVYSVVFAALLLTSGRLGDRLGRRRLFVAGVVVFVAGSLVAALARDAQALIAARIVQGVGGACILPATLSTVNAIFRGRDRVVAFAVWGAVISGMAAVGPLLGGWLTTAFTWPWIFLVNLPIGVLILAGALLVVPETRAGIAAPGLDLVGPLLSTLGFGAVIFALIEGGTFGWWRPHAALQLPGFIWPATAPIAPIPVIGAIGLLSLGLFILWERHLARRGRSAILDLRLFRIATFSWGNLTALCVAIGEFGLLLVLPLFLVNILGLTTLGAGLVLAAMALGAFGAGAAARHVAARLGGPRVVVLGLAIEMGALVFAALLLGPRVSPVLVAVLLVGYGAGLGLASAQLTGTVLADIPVEQSGQGSATQSTVRQLGAALGTAVLGAVLAVALARDLPAQLDAVPGIPPAAAQQIAATTRDSVGSVIPVLRAEGGQGRLGAADPAAAAALSAGFAQATRTTLFAAAIFLLLGLLFSTRLLARANASAAVAHPAAAPP